MLRLHITDKDFEVRFGRIVADRRENDPELFGDVSAILNEVRVRSRISEPRPAPHHPALTLQPAPVAGKPKSPMALLTPSRTEVQNLLDQLRHGTPMITAHNAKPHASATRAASAPVHPVVAAAAAHPVKPVAVAKAGWCFADKTTRRLIPTKARSARRQRASRNSARARTPANA